jgi:hypothetical protein
MTYPKVHGLINALLSSHVGSFGTSSLKIFSASSSANSVNVSAALNFRIMICAVQPQHILFGTHCLLVVFGVIVRL